MQEKEIPLVAITRLEIDVIEHALILAALEGLDVDSVSHFEDGTRTHVDDDDVTALFEKIERAEFNIWRTA